MPVNEYSGMFIALCVVNYTSEHEYRSTHLTAGPTYREEPITQDPSAPSLSTNRVNVHTSSSSQFASFRAAVTDCEYVIVILV